MQYSQLYKLHIKNYHAHRQVEKTFGIKIITSEKLQSDLYFKSIEIKQIIL